jgi:hypothetical protein
MQIAAFAASTSPTNFIRRRSFFLSTNSSYRFKYGAEVHLFYWFLSLPKGYWKYKDETPKHGYAQISTPILRLVQGGFCPYISSVGSFSNKCKFMAGLATEFGGKSQQELLYAMALWQDPDIQRFILWYVQQT